MYYRRKLLLSLISSFGGSIEKLVLQQLLLIVSKLQAKPDYFFVPSVFGGYSYQANADLKTLSTYGNIIDSEDHWVLNDRVNYNSLLNQQDKLVLLRVKQQFKDVTNLKELCRYTFTKYPYYAINSVNVDDVLLVNEIQRIETLRPINEEMALYTIGYEGISLEQYINKLIRYDVKVLCDVRSNAFSQKFGFSKKQLQQACNDTNIEYHHIPQLGIKSDKRQQLDSQAQYDKLFQEYREKVIPNTLVYQDTIVDLLSKFTRVAITCFEANIHQCHRLHLAEAIARLPSWHYQLKHI
jgi:uncharacterized protein (DUF488 family)